tara:strand:- start:44 stop:775 length:732 start_codon:yes stop_codon:yes gene_type:complete
LKIRIVAEIGSNWEGKIEKASKLIKECKKSGANAVKFQMWRAADLYSQDHPQWKVIKKSELTFEQVKQMKKISDKIKIDFFCSAFYPEAVRFLESIGVKNYKIASRTSVLKDPFSLETLRAKAKTKKPVFVSMGLGGDKKLIRSIFRKNKITFCYCKSIYPLQLSKINWKEAIKFDGFSDHTLGITAPIVFAILKKQKNVKEIMIEKHVKLENSKGPDASTSITTIELAELVKHVRLIERLNL